MVCAPIKTISNKHLIHSLITNQPFSGVCSVFLYVQSANIKIKKNIHFFVLILNANIRFETIHIMHPYDLNAIF